MVSESEYSSESSFSEPSSSSSFSDLFTRLNTQSFESKQEALDYAYNHARSSRFGLSTKRSTAAGTKVDLCCDRGSHQDQKKESKCIAKEQRKRIRKSKQIECPYRVHIRYLKRQDMWKVSEGTKGKPAASFHNHAPSKSVAAHASNRRPPNIEKEEILRLDKAGIKTAGIITILQQNREKQGGSAEDVLTGTRDIANIIARNRQKANNGLTNAEAAIELLQKHGWRYTVLQYADSHLTDIMYMPSKPMYLELYREKGLR